jgi:hypothetical protein
MLVVGASPVRRLPRVKSEVHVRKRLTGEKIVESRPMRGFVQDEAI